MSIPLFIFLVALFYACLAVMVWRVYFFAQPQPQDMTVVSQHSQEHGTDVWYCPECECYHGMLVKKVQS